IDVHRESVGFEKTFFDGNASVELRQPLNTLDIQPGFNPGQAGTSTGIGDLTGLCKYALLNDDSVDVISVGVAATVPTGPDAFANSGNSGSMQVEVLHNIVVEPFVGFICDTGCLYLHGFVSVDLPTASHDVTL